MNPLKIPKRTVEVDYKGTVWYCTVCHATQPRFEKDQVKNVLDGGIKCICSGNMIVKFGGNVPCEPAAS